MMFFSKSQLKSALLGLLIISSFCVLPIAAQDKIRLTNGEWAPYLSKDLPHHGVASHVVKAAFAAVGIETEYGFYPWKRSYKLAKQGIYNGTLVWVYTAERAKDFLYSDVVIEDPEYLFHLRSLKLNWQTVEDLRGLTIGVTLHTVYPPLEKASKSGILRIERAGNYENLYRRLIKKRIHAIPQVGQVGKYYLRTTLDPQERAQITHSDTIIQMRRYHLILSKKARQGERFIELFNDGLKIIRRNGKYTQMFHDLEKGRYDK